MNEGGLARMPPVETRCIASLFHREGKVGNSDPDLRVASPSGAGGAGVPIIVPGLRSIRRRS